MRIVTWNVRHGGGTRAQAFAETLISLGPDVAIITEFRNGSTGEKIKKVLEQNGLVHFCHASTPARLNSVLLSSRIECSERELASLGDEGHRCAWAQIGELNVLGFYFPQNRAKEAVFDAICRIDARILSEQSLLIGDFNTGRHFLDENARTFYCAEYFDKLEDLGWTDTWRSRNPTTKEFSWFSAAGNGFRIDHAFASPGLDARILGVRYDHSVRESGLSDHSALIVDLANSTS